MVIPNKMKNIDTTLLCKILDIDKDYFIKKIKNIKSYSSYKPSVFKKHIDNEKASYLRELLFHFKGFSLEKKFIRFYPIKAAPNVLGFTGEVSQNFIKKNTYYESGDIIGKTGIEKSYEEQLRGKRGLKYIVVDKFDRILRKYENGSFDISPVHGKELTSTLDIELQKYGELLMTNKKGSIVAIEPSTGEILSLVSSPSYDPNLLVGNNRNYNYSNLEKDVILKPLFDKSVLAEYPPGSTFKIVTALIGLQEGIITENSMYKCNNGFRYKNLHIQCHCGNYYQYVDLNKAIYTSCNNYFLNVYIETIHKYLSAEKGYEIWKNHVNSFNLGSYLNNDLPTGRKGFIPSANFYNKSFGNNKWTALFNVSNAIGQGEILTTPIQLANMTAIIANRGFYYTPHIIRNRNDKYEEKKYTSINSKHFETVIKGMNNTVKNDRGTANNMFMKDLDIAAKTGTSQNYGMPDHSICIAFAPIDNPKIAICVIVENGYWGSRWGSPIASLMIEKYINNKVNRTYLEDRMIKGSLLDVYNKTKKPEQK
ncbi:penicillin-binding protein 2 [Ichthyobacterium seriolicida]|uniref:Beta-lactamase n=2 Tax=Ichthyobacterium seriolicida TaxID=242600 RepID=A0A1J1E3X7_9FLAO|nr:penicillin-binding protein 2 [Ichthyobacterium seriolicida]